MPTPKLSLTGLNADRFRHPFDQEAATNFKQLSGLDFLVRSLLRPVVEDTMYMNNIASSVQLPDIYQLLVEASRILNLETPQLYLKLMKNLG